jgi:tRNA-Thr(GGU) m(6)t(6)A37 methyltransferase TsaA
VSSTASSLTIEPLGFIDSPYPEKFAVPRQPGLVTAARSRLRLQPPFNDPSALDGIEQFSHLWLIFGFHHNTAAGWQSRVRPPRLGGNKKVGVFASRSTFRPNNLGLSVMKLIALESSSEGPVLVFEGGDLVDGTPIYDIKPYVPYADSHPQALGGYASEAPTQTLRVEFSDSAAQSLTQLGIDELTQRLFNQVLAQDPRPAYRKGKSDEKEYGVSLAGFNLKFQVTEQSCQVMSIEAL